MALENVLFPHDSFCYGGKEFWSCDYILQQHEQISNTNITSNNNLQYEISSTLHRQSCSSSALMFQDVNNDQLWGTTQNSCDTNGQIVSRELSPTPELQASVTNPERKRRRRTRSCKNKEEMESQRMTHIAVERNRRKQMNEYLAVIRSLMPTSYVQRNDQASIIGGAINYVKQLEKQLQTLEAQQKTTSQDNSKNLFTDFFTFPQYSTCTSAQSTTSSENDRLAVAEPESRAAVVAFGEIEVTVIESHANLKMLTKKRPKQLMKIVVGLQSMWLTILHVNVTTVEEMVLYTISLKIEECCQLNTVNEIADGVNHLLAKIEEDDV